MSAQRAVVVPVGVRNGYLEDQNGCHLHQLASICIKVNSGEPYQANAGNP